MKKKPMITPRKPITKIKDGRNMKYKAGKEVGYYEGMIDVFKRTLDTSALGYLVQNRNTVAKLIKENKDIGFKDYGQVGQKRELFSWGKIRRRYEDNITKSTYK